MKRKDSDCVGILSNQGEAETASNLSEYIICKQNSDSYFMVVIWIILEVLLPKNTISLL